MKLSAGAAASFIAATLTTAASAEGPRDGGVGMVPAGSKLAEEVHFFHNAILMPIITVISLFVLALLVVVVFRYNRKANPVARKFSHNTLIEIIWTGVPVLILLVIALFSFDLLYKEDRIPDGVEIVAAADGATQEFVFENDFPEKRRVSRPEHLQVFVNGGGEMRRLRHRDDYQVDGLGDPSLVVTLNETPRAGEAVVMRGGRSLVGRGADKEVALSPYMTLKVTGYQWGWNYGYPDFGDFEFASNMLAEDETTPELYRFEVDNRVVIPVGKTIRVTTTARDVIHAFALPNFAIKIDAVPGRINETWFKADKEGVYYGQCSEICGIKHAFMPIAVEVVSQERFEAWVDEQREAFDLEPMFGAAASASAANETGGRRVFASLGGGLPGATDAGGGAGDVSKIASLDAAALRRR